MRKQYDNIFVNLTYDRRTHNLCCHKLEEKLGLVNKEIFATGFNVPNGWLLEPDRYVFLFLDRLLNIAYKRECPIFVLINNEQEELVIEALEHLKGYEDLFICIFVVKRFHGEEMEFTNLLTGDKLK